MYDEILKQMRDLQEVVAHTLRRVARELANAKLSAAEVPEDVLPPVEAEKKTPRGDGDTVVAAALVQWRRIVVEPGDKSGLPSGAHIIDDYIRGSQGLAWNTTDVKTWKPNVPYTQNGGYLWCGAAAAFAYGAAGLRREIRQKHFAGTGRLWRWARKTPRFIADPRDLQPGDVVVLGYPGGEADGDHIGIFIRWVRGSTPFDDATARMLNIEGNAHGQGPNGMWYEGVVERERPVKATKHEYEFRYGVRPLPEDYDD